MRARCWLLPVILLNTGLMAVASPQQGVRWQPNLETAKRVAAQTNRLVLVHFWADPCPPCKRMRDGVFPRDDVATALEANFVPVQINVRDFPKTTREFNIERVPTDVIITPEGDVVERSVGELPAAQYVNRLNRIAAALRGPAMPEYAQVPAGPPSVSPYSGGGVRGQAADLGQRNTPPQSWPGGPRPDEYAARAAQGYSAPPWGPGYQSPTSAQSPGPSAASGWDDSWAARPGRQPVAAEFGGGTPASYQGPGSPRPQDPPPQGSPPRGFAPPASQPPMAESPVAQVRPGSVEPWVRPQPGDSTRGAPRGAGPQPQAEVPPVGMDGYCPVQLVENNRWVRGTHEGGVIHRDRLYLCASPEERRRFLADPDRYAPVLSGNDPVLAVDQNQLVPGQRKHGLRFVADGRVYLFATQASRDKFAQDPDRYAAAVTRAMGATARRVAPESPYGPGPALQPNGRY